MSNRQQVCKFFRQGKCNYGASCRFYHPASENYGNSNINNGYQNFANNNPFGNQSTGNASTTNSGNIVETVQQFCDIKSIAKKESEMRNDMNELNELITSFPHAFTSYSLKPPAITNILPLRDFSFEEDRLLYYSAKSSNTLPHYQNQIRNRQEDMKKSINYLKNNTQKAVRYLQLSLQSNNTTVKPFIEPFDPNIMVSSNQNSGNSIFGNVSAASNPFGTSSFSSNNNGAFGSAGAFSSAGATNSSQTPISSPFGSSTTNNPFGGTANNTFGKSSFGNTQPIGAFGKSGFGNNSKDFGGFGASGFETNAMASSAKPNTQSPFGNSTASSMPFGSASTSNPTSFGTNSNNKSPFNTSSTDTNKVSSPFGSSGFGSSGFGSTGFGNTNQPSVFGANRTTQVSTQSPFASSGDNSLNSGANPFSNAVFNDSTPTNHQFPTQPSGFKQCEIELPSTKIEDLHSNIVALFKSEKFELGKVPDIPPPFELCYLYTQ